MWLITPLPSSFVHHPPSFFSLSLSLSGMSIFSLFLVVMLLHASFATATRPLVQIPEGTKWNLVNNSIRQLETEPSSCRTGNPIDDCWRCDPDWETNRKMLADCAIGFGHDAVGGRDGKFYVVTDSDHDDPLNPIPGTLRHAVIQEEPLWIIFDHDMVINLNEELVMNSYKTIDGRGHYIELSNGPCITIWNITNVIIHSIYIHDCVPAGNALVRDSPLHYGFRGISDGDGISIFSARYVWIDHCTLANCRDGLIDAVYGSTAITISNNYMLHHNEVMLMGHNDDFLADKNMQVTIAFNYFGEGLVQRMPRHGYFHIVNNVYVGWKMYAIGGSANPTINSQGNVFIASDDDSTKEVTKRESPLGYTEWKEWNWRSDGDMMLNGAFFTPSGQETPGSYAKASSMVAGPASLLTDIIPSAGVLDCQIGKKC
ncbi:probable pectate lyase 5 isoform X2 [Actinidia eriantha]|uniref:probable pectate lyase 5 isoform X2 n=1 Tax=Actinidia eriantha TaxID=165200 RepID=UPI0025841E71|nr:probable pectate lyase 5 isoform X2 [Actinidia eriantha]